LLIPLSIVSYYLYLAETNYQLALAYANQGATTDKQIVLKFANNVINNPFADPNYRLQVSLYLVDVGLVPESLQNVLKIYELDPRNLEVLRWLALYEAQSNNLPKALEYRIKISEFDPWNLRNYFELGNLYKQLNEPLKMLEIRDKILSISPESEFSEKAKKELILS